MRFSLLTALLITTIVAIAVSHWKVFIENRGLRESLTLLQEQQKLEVQFPRNAYVRNVPSGEPDVWMFRVYLPPGEYSFTALGDMSNRGRRLTSAGEPFLVSCRVSLIERTAAWKLPTDEVHLPIRASSNTAATKAKDIGKQTEIEPNSRMFWVRLKLPFHNASAVFARIEGDSLRQPK